MRNSTKQKMAEQKIGEQIKLSKNADELKVEIFPRISSKDKIILNLWLVLWTLCGVAVISQIMLDSYTKDERLFMGIYLIFWVYLELRVLHAFRWNRGGREEIYIQDGKFRVTNFIGKRGLPFECEIADVSDFHYEASTEKGIWNDINRSAWMVGGEVIQYRFKEKIRRIGMKLSKKDAEKLAEQLNRFKQQHSKKA